MREQKRRSTIDVVNAKSKRNTQPMYTEKQRQHNIVNRMNQGNELKRETLTI